MLPKSTQKLWDFYPVKIYHRRVPRAPQEPEPKKTHLGGDATAGTRAQSLQAAFALAQAPRIAMSRAA